MAIFQPEKTYYGLLKKLTDLADSGQNFVQDRTGTGACTIPSYFMVFQELPLLNCKRIYFHSIIVELIAFLQNKNLQFFHEHNVHIWDDWAKNNTLVNFYGDMWNNFEGVNQLKVLIDNIRKDPYSRRHVVSAWNPTKIENASLPPCHISFIVSIINDKLNLSFMMRSTDVFLGLPFNILSYWILAELIGKLTGYEVGEVCYFGTNVHLYKNHLMQAKTYVQRVENQTHTTFKKPILSINYKNQQYLSDFNVSDIQITNYECFPAIKADIAI